MQVKAGGMSSAKDLEMSPFEAARKLLSFEAEQLSLRWGVGAALGCARYGGGAAAQPGALACRCL